MTVFLCVVLHSRSKTDFVKKAFFVFCGSVIIKKSAQCDQRNERKLTHHTFVGFLSRMDPHVDEQLVASIEGFVTSHATSPETGKLFPFALIDVHLLNVSHQLLLAAVGGTAVNPMTRLVLLVLSSRSIKPWERKWGTVLTVVASKGLAHLEMLPLLVVNFERSALTW